MGKTWRGDKISGWYQVIPFEGFAGIKVGTEAETMRWDEIRFIKYVMYPDYDVPMTIKIGGPDARADMMFAKEEGIKTILAPMVESVYAFKNFINFGKAFLGCKLAINIETETAYDNLSKMMNCREWEFLSKVTVGRSDLSASMGCSPDDPKCMDMVEDIIFKVSQSFKFTSVGGSITPKNANAVANLDPHTINTRNVIINAAVPNISDCVEKALLWEIDLYNGLAVEFPDRVEFYRTIVNRIRERLA